MHILEYRFTDAEVKELSTRATTIIETFRPLSRASLGLLAKEEYMDMAALACTTALYDALGKHHPLFTMQHNRPDVLVMHNVPTHAGSEKDERFNPDLFMTLALTGPLKQALRIVDMAQTVPAWHQDNPKIKGDGDIVTLYCVNPGEGKVPTGFMSVDPLIKPLSGDSEYRVATDSQGKKLLHMPSYYGDDALTRAMKDVPAHYVPYEKGTMVAFRDLRSFHRTGVDITTDPETGYSRYDKPKGRHMHRNILSESVAGYDFTSSPDLALANLRIAAAAMKAHPSLTSGEHTLSSFSKF